jgi:hypothetical protein
MEMRKRVVGTPTPQGRIARKIEEGGKAASWFLLCVRRASWVLTEGV